jgi:membrane protein required for colicin V production
VSLLDILLALIVGTSILAGFMAGFARVGIGFCAAIAGVVLGFCFYGIPAAWLHKFVGSPALANVLGFLAVFWAILTAGAILAKIVATLFKWTGLTFIDRLLGGAFGVVRGAVIGVAFVAALLAFTPKPLPNWMVTSQLLPYAVDASNLFASIAPADLKDAFHEGLDEIRKDWDEEVKKSQRKKDRGTKPEPRPEPQPFSKKLPI